VLSSPVAPVGPTRSKTPPGTKFPAKVTFALLSIASCVTLLSGWQREQL
jgi:hypothetical protein